MNGGIMRKFKMGLITLAASVAVLAPTGLASAGTQSASAPATANTCTALVGCGFQVVGDINGNQVVLLQNVSAQVAALNCNNIGILNVAALLGLNITGQKDCDVKNHNEQNGKVIRIW
jgi:hypothetical protein